MTNDVFKEALLLALWMWELVASLSRFFTCFPTSLFLVLDLGNRRIPPVSDIGFHFVLPPPGGNCRLCSHRCGSCVFIGGG